MSSYEKSYLPALTNKDTNAYLDSIFEGKALPHHLLLKPETEYKIAKILNDVGIRHDLDKKIKLRISDNSFYQLYQSQFDNIKASLEDSIRCPQIFLDFYGSYVNSEQNDIIVLPYNYYGDHISPSNKHKIPNIGTLNERIKKSHHCILFINANDYTFFYDILNIKTENKQVKCFLMFFYIFLCFFMFFYIFLCFFMFFYIFLCLFMFV